MENGVHSGGPIGYASMLISIKQTGNDCELNLDWEFPVGNGTSTNLNSGLLRPFKSLFTFGKPLGKTIFVLYEEDENYYVLGSLSKSNQHLFYFPGGDLLELVHHEGEPVPSNSMHIDHFTLDQSYRTWHVTFAEKATKNTRIPQNRTLKIKDDLFLWFVIQSNSVKSFEKMPKRLQAKLIHKKSEVDRRSKEINEARTGAIFPSCNLPHESLPEPHMINFEFFVSVKGKPNLSDVKIFYNKPDNPIDDNRITIPNKVHTIEFPGFSEIVSIRVSKFPGSHNVPWNFNSGHIFKNS